MTRRTGLRVISSNVLSIAALASIAIFSQGQSGGTSAHRERFPRVRSIEKEGAGSIANTHRTLKAWII